MAKADFPEIFNELKKILSPVASKLDLRRDEDNVYEVFGNKTVETNVSEEEKVEDVYFASAKIQASFVGYYFFPIYTHPDEFKNISPILNKSLKGKTCFHLKTFTPEIFKELDEITKKGINLYQKLGYIEVSPEKI